MDQFCVSLDQLGQGRFGSVVAATEIETGELVALKKIRLQRIEEQGIPVNVWREMMCLSKLQHPNILQMQGYFPSGTNLIIVFERMAGDLASIISDMARPFLDCEIKSFMSMILHGISHLHQNNMIHRDLKPGNILVSFDGVLKIGDFGLARLDAGKDRPMTGTVATRWYRAPELLYGARSYTSAVDIWAVGCVLGELLNLSPIFPGTGDIDQLFLVLKQFGTVTDDNWSDARHLPDFNKINFHPQSKRTLDFLIPNASHESLELLRTILALDPNHRMPATQVLKLPYFSRLPRPAPLQRYLHPATHNGNTKDILSYPPLAHWIPN